LVGGGPPERSDLIFVLAGLPERKVYGLELFRKNFAPRLILSVGRFEVRKMARLGFERLNLRELAARRPPDQRHFFIDISADSQTVVPAENRQGGTFHELVALASYLGPAAPKSLTLISTSIHLPRVEWCCGRINGLRQRKLSYVPVPEELSSFRRDGWWKRRSHWSYLAAEYSKSVAYFFLFRDNDRNHGPDGAAIKKF